MNKTIITLLLSAGIVVPAFCAEPGTAGNYAIGTLWPTPAVNAVDADGYATRGFAMFDSFNDLGAAEAMRNAVASSSLLTPADRAELERIATMAAVLDNGDDAVNAAKAWLDANLASPHRADMALLLANLMLERGETAYAMNAYEAIDIDALSPALRTNFIYHEALTRLRLADYDSANDGFNSSELLADAEYSNAARFYMGYIRYVKRDYRSAVELFDKVNRATRPGMLADYYCAQIAYLDGRYDEALRLARPLLSNSNVPVAYTAETNRIIGEALYQKGDNADAIPYLKKYVSAVETPELSTCYILGLAQYADGDYNGAILSLTPVSAQNSAMGQSAFLYIGQAMLKINEDTNGAIMAFNRAINMDYDPAVTEVAYYNYAVAKSRGANMPFTSSVKTFENFLARFPESRFADDVAVYIVNGYVNDDNYEAALASINRVKHPSSTLLGAKQKVLYTMGSRKLAAGMAADAVGILRQAEELSHYDSAIATETKLALGEALYFDGEYDEAANYLLDYVSAVPSSNPNRAVALYDLGYTRMAQKEWSKAATNFERVVAAPGDLRPAAVADVQSRLGDARYYQRDWRGAAKAYDAAYNTDPASGDYPLSRKAVMLGYAHDYSGKLATTIDFEKRFPTSALMPDVLMEKAEAYVQLGKADDADDVYRDVIDRYPSTTQGRRASLFLASDLAVAGNVDDAIETYQQLIARAATSDEARQAVEAVKRLHADRGTLGQYNEFIADIDGAPEMNDVEAETLAWNAAQRAFLTNENTSLLEQYVDSYPRGKFTAQALSYLLDNADDGLDYDSAYKYATRLVKEFPDNAAVENALIVKADIDYNMGRGMDALHAWEILETKASTADNKNIARMGIMRVARDLGDGDRLLAAAEAVLATSTPGSEEKTEAAFSRALARSLKGDTDAAVAEWTELSAAADDLYGAKSAVYAAEALNAAGKYKEAASLSEKFVNTGTPHTYWLGRAFIALSDAYDGLDRKFEAREYLKALKDNYPGDETDIFQMIEDRLAR